MAFSYVSQEELALPLLTGSPVVGGKEELFELEAESIHKLPAGDVGISVGQKSQKKAPRPNRARRAFRHTQLAVNQFLRRRHRADHPRNKRLPLSMVEVILRNLDIRGAATEEDKYRPTTRAPVRPCPHSAQDIYDRLQLSRRIARRGLTWRLYGCSITTRPAWCVTHDELPQLLSPVIAEMKACLGYVGAFRALLDIDNEGCDAWLDLSHLRMCVFRLMGYWPHDVKHNLEAWAFGLPDDLARLLYPQCGRFDHREMAMNLDWVVLGPGSEAVASLEGCVRVCERWDSQV
ncbi:hypothetical protein J7T55_011778 [Diaporthe amygdali]|uniref:uncharacterized protein n=1 Tax=Phomopsis amygdali TaxID=1214568 RepID=UPI0022FE2678|nr:uncharacterized protein J7T55_011778 [Diaporthe amygdali]KAJ0123313.1 hypothetical protein J7T55_011778 [Diaporthe amygdali]